MSPRQNGFSVSNTIPDLLATALAAGHHHLILGTTWTGFGALLIVAGAVMVLGDATATIGMTIVGTRPQPPPA
jgi:hypothetical protein